MGNHAKMREKMSLLPFYNESAVEAGCDEAGRGCLAGPVTAAAVILPKDFRNDLLNDSKQLTEPQRNRLRIIVEQQAVAWAVAMVQPEEIDKINILNASFTAMNLAVEQLSQQPGHLLIDGNRFKNNTGIPHTCFVGGDGRFLSIAAASVLAKTHRDEWMQKLHNEFPQYGWEKNKGYPTKFHQDAILLHGISPYHRQTFKIAGQQLLLW